MSAVQRPSPLSLVLELTRRLAEEFDTLPIPSVTSAVRSAVSAAQLFGSDLTEQLGTIERIAREELLVRRATVAEQADARLAFTG